MEVSAVERMFRAFAEPTRMRILHLLREGELCVGDLVALLGVPQPTASRHLTRLRREGLVEVRREGRWALYSLARPGSRFHENLLRCVGSCFEEVPEFRRDLARLRELRGRDGCCPGTARGEGRGRDERRGASG